MGSALLLLTSLPRIKGHAHPAVTSAELLQPITRSGAWVDGPALPIDKAHRQAVPHRGIWLFVTTTDGQVLVLRRSQHMVTCPGALSIIGEHHKGVEDDVSCARRAIHEELPALLTLPDGTLEMVPLRVAPRWFLYDYPDGKRFDRCLITEFVARLDMNTSMASSWLLQPPLMLDQPFEQEASSLSFMPLSALRWQLLEQPNRFCAPRLFPACLLDSVHDICRMLWRAGIGRAGCEGVHGAPLKRGRTAMASEFDPARIVGETAGQRGAVELVRTLPL